MSEAKDFIEIHRPGWPAIHIVITDEEGPHLEPFIARLDVRIQGDGGRVSWEEQDAAVFTIDREAPDEEQPDA